jgi:hypothetical protein
LQLNSETCIPSTISISGSAIYATGDEHLETGATIKIKNTGRTKMRKAKRVGVFLSIPAKFNRWVGDRDYGPAIRQEIIDRWRFCGFEVFSVNSQDEAKELAPLISGIEIIPVEDRGRIKISSIIRCAVERKFDTALIANADCVPIDVKLISEIIGQVGANELCLLGRCNVPPETLSVTREPFPGYDVFVIGSEALGKAPKDSIWCIGDTCWDYWFPLYQMTKGTAVFRYSAYTLLHLDHPRQWSDETWLKNAHLLFEEFPVGSKIYGDEFNDRYHPLKGKQLSDTDIRTIFTDVLNIIAKDERTFFSATGKFNELLMQIFKDRFGPVIQPNWQKRLLSVFRK